MADKEDKMNHWQGKTWYAYGTSMTSIAQGKYVPIVEELSGLKVVNKGIPGGSLTPDGFGKGNNKLAVMNMDDGKENADREEIYRAIWDYEKTLVTEYTSRLTADVVLANINVVTKHYAKRFSNRRKKQ